MSDKITTAQQARLASIDFHLLHLGKVTRREHMQRFDLSSASASKDIALYLDYVPKGQVSYDARDRVYLASDSFKPVYQQPSVRMLHILGQYHTPEEMLALHRMLTARLGIAVYSTMDVIGGHAGD